MPRVHADGALIAGDAGGFLNSMRLKGIHLAMRTGMLAAETAFEAVRGRRHVSATRLAAYQQRIDASPVPRGARSRCATCTRPSATGCCRACCSPALSHADARTLAGRSARPRPATRGCGRCAGTTASSWRRPTARGAVPPDRVLTFDKLTNVHYSGHRARRGSAVAPAGAHRRVHVDLRSRVRAPVHPVLPGQRLRDRARRGRRRRACRSTRRTACTARRATSWTPTGVITWVPPEGGGGPQYNGHVT